LCIYQEFTLHNENFLRISKVILLFYNRQIQQAVFEITSKIMRLELACMSMARTVIPQIVNIFQNKCASSRSKE